MAPHGENPFVGLRAFDYEQRARFFGRERQSYALYRLTAFGFIAVVGNSGSGKSSLVRAGLLPLLADPQERQPWRVAVMTPGGTPLERLAAAIATLAPEHEDNDAHAVRFEHIRYLLERSSNGIGDALDEIPELADKSVLLVVDQFEEIFRIAAESREETAAFVALLLQLHRRRPSAHVLITMRSDFIGDCSRFSGLPEAVSDTQYLVPSLSREQRQAAIVKPIARAGATIEPTLVERLINEAGFESDQLPVLQHALSRMWLAASDRVAASNAETLELTEADYRAIGTLDGALSQHADAVMSELVGREHVVEAVFRALSERDAEGRATRRVLTLRQLVAETGMPEADVLAVVDRFRAPDCAFLLPAGGGLTPETRIDVVHEALLRRWERLTPSDPAERGWLEREEEDGRYYRSLLARIDSGETTLQLDRVTERYAWWTSVPHTDAWAMRYGGRHDRVEDFFASSLAALAESERAHAQAEADERERRKQKGRATRRFLIVSGSISAIAIALLIVTFFALLGSQRTTNASLVTQSKLVARDAETLLDRGDATNAALLALEVLPQHLAAPDRPFTWAAYGALTDALANLREIRDYRLSGDIYSAQYAPDGTRFVALRADGTIWIWKIGAIKPDLELHAQAYVIDVEFSADGRLIAAGSNKGDVHIWSTTSGRPLPFIRGCRDGSAVDRAVFTADGRHLVTSCEEEAVTRLYDVRTGQMLREVPGNISYLYTRQGTIRERLITSEASKVTIWDASLTHALHVFRPARASIVDAAISADEEKIVIAYDDLTASVFDARSGRRITRLVGRDQILNRVRFDPTGKYVFTVNDASTRVWDAATGATLTTIAADSDGSFFPAVSRDGNEIVLADGDGSFGVFSSRLGARLVNVAGDVRHSPEAAFSLDGKRLLVPSLTEGLVREWDISTSVSRILDETAKSGHFYLLRSTIAVSRDGERFAVGDDTAMRIYDARTGRVVRSLPDVLTDPFSTFQAAFSPDGRTLLVAGSEFAGTQRWDWRQSKRLPPFADERTHDASEEHRFHAFPIYAPDGRSFASTRKGVVRIRDSGTGRTLRSFSGNQKPLLSVTYSADGRRLLTGSKDGWIRVYDPHSGKRIIAFPASRNIVTDAVFSPDARLIASGTEDGSVRIWNATTGTQIASFATSGIPYTVAFAGDGKRVLIGGDDGVRIWDFATNRTTLALRGSKGTLWAAAFALHDSRVITIGIDSTLRLWTVPALPACQHAIDEARTHMAHELTPALRDTEFITPRHSPSILNALLPSQSCS